ncbi:MAG: M20 family metallo-hydrolase [Paludibacter sp.]|nr:M20 family metallo-hydrolase [Paludibacter sp.]
MIPESNTQATELLQKLIEIPSYSKEEVNVSDFLVSYIEAKGYAVSRKDNNIWLMSPGFDSSRPTILLNSHIDTVKPVTGWTRDPFTPTVENGKLYGLGSNDAGASVVSLLFAFFYLTQQPQTFNLIFAATAEEEISGKNGIESLIKELPPIDFAIVGEPTGMQPAIAEKGLMVLDCTVCGKAGHAARNDGENAIYKALKDIEWFRTYQFSDSSELLGPVKMTVTQVNAGTQHNVIPDKCSFVVDIRSNEKYTNSEILTEILKNVNCDVLARSTRLTSSATPLDHPFVKRAKELNLKPYGSPTLSDQALMPFQSVKIGPGDSVRSHTADEFVLVDEIHVAIDLYVQLLNGLKL